LELLRESLTAPLDLNNPPAPFSNFHLEFFSGADAPLKTPAACGTYAVTSQLTPYSAPDSGPPATPSDEWQITASPQGGACPATEGQLPHSPGFEAGSASALAGHYSPFNLNLRGSPPSRMRSRPSLRASRSTCAPPRWRLDKQSFTLNGTSCNPLAVSGALTSTLGAVANLHNRFQLGECSRLGFKPRIALRLTGKRFTRGSNPRLRAVIVPRPGDANIKRIAVKMPRSLFLDQSHIRTVCTRVQFAANACPKGFVYGRVTARSPLLDYRLAGKVYLRSSSHKLPDLIADLRGPARQPLRIEGAGRTDSVKGALRNTFDFVPDAPVSKIALLLQAGPKSLLVASRDLCKGTQRAFVNFRAHNGRRRLLRQPIAIPRCKKQKRSADGRGGRV
jgi:hypothetical protein